MLEGPPAVQRFRNILVLYQGWLGDEATLDRAVAVARDNGADLTLATIVRPSREPRRTVLPLAPPEAAALRKALVEEKLRHLQRLAAGIPAGNFRIHCRVLDGPPAGEVRRLVRQEHIDLVMMTADYASLLGAVAFGSVAVDCMRKASCPIWLSPARGQSEPGRVVAAVDPGAGGEPSPLAVEVLDTAATLARQRGARLDILHAWDLDGADLETSRSEIDEAIRSRLLGRATTACGGAVARLCAAVDLGTVPTEVHLARGHPVDAIARFASERNVELIVMGAARRAGLAAALFRSPAEKLVERVSASVLTLRRPARRATSERGARMAPLARTA